jgi:hypothetical protein
MKWGGRGRARGGGGLVVVQKYMGSMVYRGGGGPEAYTTPYTTLHKHATCTGGGGVGPAGHRPSSLQLYTKVPPTHPGRGLSRNDPGGSGLPVTYSVHVPGSFLHTYLGVGLASCGLRASSWAVLFPGVPGEGGGREPVRRWTHLTWGAVPATVPFTMIAYIFMNTFSVTFKIAFSCCFVVAVSTLPYFVCVN